MLASSLKCFYDTKIRNMLNISNLSWDCRWDCAWNSDDTTIFIDGHGNWEGLDDCIKKNIVSNNVLYQCCSKKEQKNSESNCKWVKEVDYMLDNVKEYIKQDKGLDGFYDNKCSFDGMEVYIKHS